MALLQQPHCIQLFHFGIGSSPMIQGYDRTTHLLTKSNFLLYLLIIIITQNAYPSELKINPAHFVWPSGDTGAATSTAASSSTPGPRLVPGTVFLRTQDAEVDLTPTLPPLIPQLLGQVTVPTSLERGQRLSSGSSAQHPPNCFGAVLAVLGLENLGYVDEASFLGVAREWQFVSPDVPLELGDVIYLPGVRHAAIYLFDGYIFQKPTWSTLHPHEIVRYERIFDTFNATLEIAKRFPNGHGSHHSYADAFLTTISHDLPLDPPPALESRSRSGPLQVLRNPPFSRETIAKRNVLSCVLALSR